MIDAAKPAVLGGEALVAEGLLTRWPTLTEDDKAAVARVLERGVLSGPFAPESVAFEQEFASFVGAKFAFVTHSGTSALHLACAGAGVGPGDEVIVPAYSFVATPMSVLHQQAIPVFVDIEEETGCLDPTLIEAAITPRTKAIMPVHMHGTAADLAPILELAARRGLVVLEDAAQAHGARWNDRPVGAIGAAGGFSMQSSKNLSVGEGGIFVTNDEAVAATANRWRNFGEDIRPSDFAYDRTRPLDAARAYESVTVGFMYRGQEMTSALGRSRLARLAADTARAQAHHERLVDGLSDLPGLILPTVPAGRTSVFHKYRIRLDATAAGVADKLPDDQPTALRDCLIEALAADGIEAVLWQSKPLPAAGLFRNREGYGGGHPWSLHDQDVWPSYQPEQFPVTQRLLDHSFCLFSQSHPLIAQEAPAVEAYIAGIRRVWEHLPAVVDRWVASHVAHS